jgi:hypothetical protein
MKLIFESEYEKHSFEKLLESIYQDSAPGSKGINVTENLADSLASLFVKVSKSETSVEKTDYTESITTTGSLSLPALPELPYFGKDQDE